MCLQNSDSSHTHKTEKDIIYIFINALKQIIQKCFKNKHKIKNKVLKLCFKSKCLKEQNMIQFQQIYYIHCSLKTNVFSKFKNKFIILCHLESNQSTNKSFKINNINFISQEFIADNTIKYIYLLV